MRSLLRFFDDVVFFFVQQKILMESPRIDVGQKLMLVKVHFQNFPIQNPLDLLQEDQLGRSPWTSNGCHAGEGVLHGFFPSSQNHFKFGDHVFPKIGR